MKLEECYDRDVNVAELARKMRFSRGFVVSVLNGRTEPGWRFLEALEKVDVNTVKKKYKYVLRIEALKDLNSKENLIEEKVEVSDT
jgi:transcriptional regulator with XRE-family HTH domain